MKSKNFNETHSPKYNQPSHHPPFSSNPTPLLMKKTKGKLDLLIENDTKPKVKTDLVQKIFLDRRRRKIQQKDLTILHHFNEKRK
jgi:hypothetical protein